MKKRVKTRQKKLKRKDTIKKYDKKLTKRNNRKLIRTKKNKTKRNKTKRNKIRINYDNLKGGNGLKKGIGRFLNNNKKNAGEIAKMLGEEAIKLSPGGEPLLTLVKLMVNIKNDKKNNPPVEYRLDLIEKILTRITQELIFKGITSETELEKPGVNPRPVVNLDQQEDAPSTSSTPPASPVNSPDNSPDNSPQSLNTFEQES